MMHMRLTRARLDDLARDVVARYRNQQRECARLAAQRDRLAAFVTTAFKAKDRKNLQTRIKTISRDVISLSDHASFLTNKVTFALDAILGLVSIEQNGIIKIFSVAAVVFLPPTLVASIYGMNFQVMPELGFDLGYPMALVLMVISAVAPYLYFKRKGWL